MRTFVVVLGALLGACSLAFSGVPLTLDHFKCYDAKTTPGTPKFQPLNVFLEDQFEDKDTRVLKPDTLCNPVDKNGGGIIDPTAHLKCYDIKDVSGQTPFDGRDVIVVDQFGTEELTLGKPRTLCVPATKDGQPSILDLDHFKCYDAKTRPGTPKFQPQTVTLVDQFEAKDTKVLKPDSLCNPVSKNDEPIIDETAHLKCYDIKDVSGQEPFEPREVVADDQFGTEQLTVTKSRRLCVPASKTVRFEPNDTCATAIDFGAVNLSFNLTSSLDKPPSKPDVDFYKFSLTPGAQVQVDLQGDTSGQGTLFDPFLGFFDSACTLIDSDDDSGVGFRDSRLVVTVPADGIVILGASSFDDFDFNGDGIDHGSYKLSIK
jgi:hypothetical protein